MEAMRELVIGYGQRPLYNLMVVESKIFAQVPRIGRHR
jgi:hypothetical protein